jgi:hypothetical protein
MSELALKNLRSGDTKFIVRPKYYPNMYLDLLIKTPREFHEICALLERLQEGTAKEGITLEECYVYKDSPRFYIVDFGHTVSSELLEYMSFIEILLTGMNIRVEESPLEHIVNLIILEPQEVQGPLTPAASLSPAGSLVPTGVVSPAGSASVVVRGVGSPAPSQQPLGTQSQYLSRSSSYSSTSTGSSKHKAITSLFPVSPPRLKQQPPMGLIGQFLEAAGGGSRRYDNRKTRKNRKARNPTRKSRAKETIP